MLNGRRPSGFESHEGGKPLELSDRTDGMEAELVQLAREAVVALRQPNWAEIGGLGIGLGQILVILGGLWMMHLSGKRRDTQLDAITTALDRQGEALGKVGQALDRQGAVLAELLRRSNAP